MREHWSPTAFLGVVLLAGLVVWLAAGKGRVLALVLVVLMVWILLSHATAPVVMDWNLTDVPAACTIARACSGPFSPMRSVRYSKALELVVHSSPALHDKLECQCLRLGREHFAKKRVVICGLIRDACASVPDIQITAEGLGSLFADYRVLVVENDSKDCTRSELLRWKERNPRVTVLGCLQTNARVCQMGMDRTVPLDSIVARPSRIQKMVQLRNTYLDELNSNLEYRDFDYVIVWDMDLRGILSVEGIWDTGCCFAEDIDASQETATWNERPKPRDTGNISLEKIQVVGCNSIVAHDGALCTWRRYHDPYAYRNGWNHLVPKLVNDVVWGYFGAHRPVRSMPIARTSTTTTTIIAGDMHSKPDYQRTLIPVESCFGGFAIYRRNVLKGKRYSTSPNLFGQPVCEHVGLHASFPSGSVYLNRNMVASVTANPK